MVLSAQKNLLRYVDEHATSCLDVWHLLSTHFSNTTYTTYTLENSYRFHTHLASQLQQRGLQSLQVNSHLLYAEQSNTETPHTLLLCHSYAAASQATLSQQVADSAAFLCALDAYKKVMGSLPPGIAWLLTGSEIDQQTLLNLKELDPSPTGCIWYHDAETGVDIDTQPVLALGTKGLLHVELEVHTANHAIDFMHGGIAPDPLWRLLWALNTLKDAREDILIDGFYDTLATAQDDTVEQLHLLPDITADLIQRWGIQQPLMGLHGFQLHYAHLLLPTCTIHNIVTNPEIIATETTIPMLAKAQVVFYLVPDQDPQDIFAKLQRHLQAGGFSDVHVRLLSSANPVSTPITNSFVQHVLQATEAAYAQKPCILPTTLGSYTAWQAWMKAATPIVFIPRNVHNGESAANSFTNMVKQMILLIESVANANNTTE